ncbi:MAG: hypothetical protein MK106_06140 [Mariniblastus sp.]|nr:hypothetical protein [Mariniblastus sp.]
MRLILAASIPFFLFGGVTAYVEFTNRVKPKAIEYRTQSAPGSWSVQLYTTAELVGDLDFDEPSLKVLFKGQTILEDFDTIAAKEQIVIDPLNKVSMQPNSLFLQARCSAETGADAKADRHAAIRVQVYRGKQQVAEKTFWKTNNGQLIRGELTFKSATDDSDQSTHDSEGSH